MTVSMTCSSSAGLLSPLRRLTLCVLVCAAGALACAAGASIAADAQPLEPSGSGQADIHRVDFNRDVRPILAKHCFTCHGPDEGTREADLRLDTQAGARQDLGGYQAIKPGAVEESELILRVTSDDEDLRMPPADGHPPLDETEIATLRRWIHSGGEYEVHWSFQATTEPSLPAVQNPGWCRGPIDRFVLHRMEQNGLSPNAEADPVSLIRRVYLDLLGTTPTPEEVDRFVASDRPDAYEALVDRLLASPEYGERFARSWLDLARYSDTNGYEKDRPRTIWPYRNWVIDALNADKPYDAFSIEQLAGDMLADATRSQRIATGFHRNTMLNEEGGIDPLEYRFYAMVDRVATTGTVWMGLTTGCAQCHTHKYDPLTHTDYYALMALMDNADEPELNADPPAVIEQRVSIQQQIAATEKDIVDRVLLADDGDTTLQAAWADWQAERREQLSDWRTVAPDRMESTMPTLAVLDDGSVLASGDATKRDVYSLTMPAIDSDKPITAIRIEALSHPTLPAKGPGLAFYEGRRGDFFLSELEMSSGETPVALAVGTTSVPNAKPGNGKTFPGNLFDADGSTGWSIPGDAGQTHRLVIPLDPPTRLDQAWSLEMLFERHYVAGLGRFRIDVTTDEQPQAMQISSDLQRQWLASKTSGRMSPELKQDLALEFLRGADEMAEHRKPIDRLRNQLPDDVRTLVMQERPETNRRVTRRRHRGEYLQPKESVDAAVPEFFATGPEDGPSDRLELAQWLVSDANPLVGRVTANRAWREFFGTGIVRTAGDFGTQSEPPSHPQLLDYLDVRLRDTSADGIRWSIKRLHREIVLSATYRQSIGTPPSADPDNRLLSVFPYRRYDAERIRDAFLSGSRLLSRQIGGPSVYPPQPESVVQMAYGNTAWPTSTGADRYRRSLYTYSKRTAPFAAYTTFDAPSGELCIARRDRSTTPLQALTLLNDQMYLEIAEGFADAAVRDAGRSGSEAEPRDIARRLFRLVLVRQPGDGELDAILTFFRSQSEHERPWMLVARALMNTDEAITTP
ncbi:PSD1 and planctomycete cytochrome C domain-containing protein [Stieleria sp. ICT_E10.1]|uniref:PSD1 and planctomycete cytochrome C domain-containing protein n=1 Tax=Stieleria sedimenti TaxID=2976331 RepID=UPI00218048F8|nr:PSD1 and planctomycete cytochrome C domain-containing protein [Stieleria sedimenti]MCS7469920.1 PSD1 and planctomycete cytochrome C domain-containing protein [Stieleria sedimenti]